MAKKNLENKLLVVVRVRGTARVRASIAETLKRLNLKRVNNLILIHTNKSNIGMLNKCIDFVTFGEIEKDMIEKVLEKNGTVAKKEDLEGIMTGKKNLKEIGVQWPIRMHPPKHGYEGIKLDYKSGGALGYRGVEINKLIKRML